MTPKWQNAIVLLFDAREKVEEARELFAPTANGYLRLSGLMDDLADVADYIEAATAEFAE